MLKTFLQFVKESQDIENQAQSQDPKKPTLFIIGDVGYNSPDVQWFLTIDVKDIWKEYDSKSIDFNEFVDKYKQKITEKKAELEKVSDTCWYDIQEIMNQSGEYDEEKSSRYFNRIYDWGDEHGIKIETIQSQPQQTDNQTQTEEAPAQNNNLIK